MSVKIQGSTSGNILEVNTSNQVKVVPETDAANNSANVGCLRTFQELDNGSILGTAVLKSGDIDSDYRQKVSSDTLLDTETFNYTAQNTGKHTFANATMAVAWGTSGMSTNSGAIVTTGTGLTFGSYAEFPVLGNHDLYCELECGFSVNPQANVIIDFGMFRRGASAAYAPADGAFFRLTSAGLQGVISNNGSESYTSTFGFTPVIAQKYQFIVQINQRQVSFWVNEVLYGVIVTPNAQGQPFISSTLPFSVRQAHIGTAGGVLSFTLNNYSILLGGSVYAEKIGERANAIMGSYQGLSGGTMGSLSAYTNSTNPTAAVPSNTALTANLPTGLGGQAWETVTLAVNTDGILLSYQVPAGTISVPGKRLRVIGVKLSSFIQTIIAGGPLNRVFTLAFGHTAVSLATTEAATTKKPRIVLLPELTQTITATQAVSTVVAQVAPVCNFTNPIYVNPGEFVQVVVKHIGTVGVSGTIATNIQLDYSWE